MITFYTDSEPWAIAECAALCGDVLPWAGGTTLLERAHWCENFAHWFHVIEGPDVLGFMAWVDHEDGTRAIHFGKAPNVKAGRAILKGYRLARRWAASDGRELVAYIRPEQIDIERLASALGITRKANIL
jgi:hypothetical protein